MSVHFGDASCPCRQNGRWGPPVSSAPRLSKTRAFCVSTGNKKPNSNGAPNPPLRTPRLWDVKLLLDRRTSGRICLRIIPASNGAHQQQFAHVKECWAPWFEGVTWREGGREGGEGGGEEGDGDGDGDGSGEV